MEIQMTQKEAKDTIKALISRPIDFTWYQKEALKTCTAPCFADQYLDLGYLSEAGELAGKLAKRVRGDFISDVAILYEIGDIAWFIAVKASLHDVDLILDYSKDVALCDFPFGNVKALFGAAIDAHKTKWETLITVCTNLGFDFEECLKMNIQKLASRQERGVIQGNGDNR